MKMKLTAIENFTKPIPRGVDVYHGDLFMSDVKRSNSLEDDFNNLDSNGIWFCIHKATQGVRSTDNEYIKRRQAAKQSKLKLWGAYTFNTGETAADQVKHFFDVVLPDANTAMFLDFEDNRASQMSISRFAEFLILGDEKLGRPIKVYSGNRIKELIANASKEIRDLCGKRDLWGCQYGPHWKNTDSNGHELPFNDLIAWQFAADGYGSVHSLPGIRTPNIDVNHFGGTFEQLQAMWIK